MTQLSLSQQAYEILKRKIISLELPPGSVIDEAGLKKELGLGRTPIREALKRLSLEKLVEILSRRGMFVTEIGITDQRELFEIRLVLEPLATRLAAQRGTAEHWRRMAAALSSLTQEDHRASNEEIIEVDEACHRIIYQAADNDFLTDSLIPLYTLSLRLWYFSLSKIGDMRGAVLEHERIMHALKAGQADRAAELMEHHILAFQEEIQAVMLDRAFLGTDVPRENL